MQLDKHKHSKLRVLKKAIDVDEILGCWQKKKSVLYLPNRSFAKQVIFTAASSGSST